MFNMWPLTSSYFCAILYDDDHASTWYMEVELCPHCRGEGVGVGRGHVNPKSMPVWTNKLLQRQTSALTRPVQCDAGATLFGQRLKHFQRMNETIWSVCQWPEKSHERGEIHNETLSLFVLTM